MVKNLRLLREERGFSQQRLAEMLNISQQAVFKYEKTSNEPDISTLIKIADIFGVTVDYLIGNSEIREKNAKLGTAILTESELSHISRWRKLPEDVRKNIDVLIESISKTPN